MFGFLWSLIWYCWFIFIFTFLGGREREAITFSYCKAETKEVALFLKILSSQDQIANRAIYS